MARTALLIALVGLCGLAAAQQEYTSLQPPAYTVSLSYNIDGVLSDPAPCNYTDACLPMVSVPDGDSVIITYSGPAGPDGATVSLMTCFSPPDSKNRAWRKPNAIINKDKQCNVEKPFATGLPTGDGTFTWTPKPSTPGNAYNIQLLVQNGSDPDTYSAMGKSAGYFMIVPIDSRPTWLMILTGVFATFGPICLVSYFYIEKVVQKRD